MKYNKVALSIACAYGALSTTVLAEEALAESVEKIVVTGQKIDRSLQDTANSVAVLTSSDIEKLSVQNVADIYNLVPNISGDFNQGFTIRGINAFNVSGGGNSFLTSMYLDGAPLPYRVVRSGALSVWDLAQVEVFRGPSQPCKAAMPWPGLLCCGLKSQLMNIQQRLKWHGVSTDSKSLLWLGVAQSLMTFWPFVLR